MVLMSGKYGRGDTWGFCRPSVWVPVKEGKEACLQELLPHAATAVRLFDERGVSDELASAGSLDLCAEEAGRREVLLWATCQPSVESQS